MGPAITPDRQQRVVRHRRHAERGIRCRGSGSRDESLSAAPSRGDRRPGRRDCPSAAIDRLFGLLDARIAVEEEEIEAIAGELRSGDRADGSNCVQNADDTAGVAPAEIVDCQRGIERNETKLATPAHRREDRELLYTGCSQPPGNPIASLPRANAHMGCHRPGCRSAHTGTAPPGAVLRIASFGQGDE